jgi:large subunit ribosomal protein L13
MTKTSFKVKIERKTHQIDATNQSIGRLACQIALLLTGKNKINYLPQVDNGDFVIVTNPGKVKLTGKKLEQKKYYSHSGYPGGLKSSNLNKIIKEKPQEAIKHAVLRMLPKNRLQPLMIKRLMFK